MGATGATGPVGNVPNVMTMVYPMIPEDGTLLLTPSNNFYYVLPKMDGKSVTLVPSSGQPSWTLGSSIIINNHNNKQSLTISASTASYTYDGNSILCELAGGKSVMITLSNPTTSKTSAFSRGNSSTPMAVELILF